MAREERRMTDMLLYRSESGEFARALWEIQQSQSEGIVLLASGRKYKVHYEGRPVLALHRGKRCVFMEGRVQTTFFGGYDVLTVVRVQDDRPQFWMQVTPHNTPFCESIRYSGWFDSPAKSMKQLFDELGHEFASLAKGDAAKAFGSTLAEYQKILLISSKFGADIKILMDKADEENKADEEHEAAKKQPVIGAIAAAAASNSLAARSLSGHSPTPSQSPPSAKRSRMEPSFVEEGETDADSEFLGVERLKNAASQVRSMRPMSSPPSSSSSSSHMLMMQNSGALPFFPMFAQPALTRSISASSQPRAAENGALLQQAGTERTEPFSPLGNRSSGMAQLSAAGLHLIANVVEEHDLLKKLSTAFPGAGVSPGMINSVSSFVDQVFPQNVTAERSNPVKQFAVALLALCPSLREDPSVVRKFEVASRAAFEHAN